MLSIRISKKNVTSTFYTQQYFHHNQQSISLTNVVGYIIFTESGKLVCSSCQKIIMIKQEPLSSCISSHFLNYEVKHKINLQDSNNASISFNSRGTAPVRTWTIKNIIQRVLQNILQHLRNSLSKPHGQNLLLELHLEFLFLSLDTCMKQVIHHKQKFTTINT